MRRVDYFKIINKYIKLDSAVYPLYIIHAVLVTTKALSIGRGLGLSQEQLGFIEEASMLHDIGIINTKDDEIHCNGDKPYILHGLEGQRILESEGLPAHARVARNHIGMGVTKEEIIKRKLPLPLKDIKAEKIEDRIISYADLFYSKTPNLVWQELSLEEVEENISRFGEDRLEIFRNWHKEFS
jgi:uncharacterized protein